MDSKDIFPLLSNESRWVIAMSSRSSQVVNNEFVEPINMIDLLNMCPRSIAWKSLEELGCTQEQFQSVIKKIIPPVNSPEDYDGRNRLFSGSTKDFLRRCSNIYTNENNNYITTGHFLLVDIEQSGEFTGSVINVFGSKKSVFEQLIKENIDDSIRAFKKAGWLFKIKCRIKRISMIEDVGAT